MDILVCLAETPNAVLSKQDLLDRVWSGRFVVDAVLKRGIHQLRKALGDSANAPQYIETVAKRGYRLLPAVQPLGNAVPAGRTAPALALAPGEHGPAPEPYRGLMSFRFADAPYFFGRRRDVIEVIHAMERQASAGRAFVLVTGPSGAGKSSLVRAGVMPWLYQHGLQGGGEGWRRAEFVPGDVSVFATLAAALGRPEALGDIAEQALAEHLPAGGLAEKLRLPPEDVVQWLTQVLQPPGQAAIQLVLLLDQFEELLVRSSELADEVDEFFALVYELARSGVIWTIATMRNDFYPAFAQSDLLLRLRHGAGHVEIRPPGAGEIGRIIRDPAQRAGLVFERRADGASLDDELHEAARERPDILPLLQFALTGIYKRRTEQHVLTFDAYEALGGIEGCVSARAEQAFNSLPVPVQQALPRLLSAMVLTHGIDDQRLTCVATQLEADTQDRALSALVDAFVDARLLSASSAPDGNRAIRVSHEAVFEYWPRAKTWLSRNQEQVRLREWLDEQSRQWQRAERDDAFLLAKGKPLNDAISVLEDQSMVLDDLAHAFVSRSRRRAGRAARLRDAIIVVLMVLCALALSAAFVAKRAQTTAQDQLLQSARVTEFLIDTFGSADPGVRSPRIPNARDILDRGAARIGTELADQPYVESALRRAMGESYRGLGLYEESEQHLLAALALRDDNSLETASTLQSLGRLMRIRGEYERAQLALDRAVALRTDMLGREHADTAQTINELGMLAQAQGQNEQAHLLLQDALWIRRQVLGDDAVPVADSLNNLASVQLQSGDIDQARAQYNEAIALYRRHTDVAGLRLANSLSNLAGIFYATGQLDKATSLYAEALEIYGSYYSEAHPDGAAVMSNYGSVLRDSGQLEQARAVFATALQALRKSLGHDHIRSFQVAIKLADADIRLANYEAAEALLQDTLREVQIRFGDTHWLHAYAQAVLASKLGLTGELERAVQMASDSVEKIVGILGEQSPFAGDAKRRLQALQSIPER